MEDIAKLKGVTCNELSRKIYMTNVSLCVPLKTETSIKSPSPTIRNNCKPYLLKQIIYINPKVIITLGSKAYEMVTRLLEVARHHKIKIKDLRTVSDCIREDISYTVKGMVIIPELHPSPLTRIGPVADLHLGFKDRLAKHISEYVDL